MTESDWQYWDLDIPGLDEATARRLVSVIEDVAAGRQVILSDPRLFLTLRLDRDTVKVLRQAVTAVLVEHDVHPDAAILTGLVEDFDAWLAGTPG